MVSLQHFYCLILCLMFFMLNISIIRIIMSIVLFIYKYFIIAILSTLIKFYHRVLFKTNQ